MKKLIFTTVLLLFLTMPSICQNSEWADNFSFFSGVDVCAHWAGDNPCHLFRQFTRVQREKNALVFLWTDESQHLGDIHLGQKLRELLL